MDCPGCKKHLLFSDRKFCVHCGFALQPNSTPKSNATSPGQLRRSNTSVQPLTRETQPNSRRTSDITTTPNNNNNNINNSKNQNNNNSVNSTPTRSKSVFFNPSSGKSINSTPSNQITSSSAPSLSSTPTGLNLQEIRLSGSGVGGVGGGGYKNLKGQPDVASLSQDLEAKGALKYVMNEKNEKE